MIPWSSPIKCMGSSGTSTPNSMLICWISKDCHNKCVDMLQERIQLLYNSLSIPGWRVCRVLRVQQRAQLCSLVWCYNHCGMVTWSMCSFISSPPSSSNKTSSIFSSTKLLKSCSLRILLQTEFELLFWSLRENSVAFYFNLPAYSCMQNWWKMFGETHIDDILMKLILLWTPPKCNSLTKSFIFNKRGWLKLLCYTASSIIFLTSGWRESLMRVQKSSL